MLSECDVLNCANVAVTLYGFKTSYFPQICSLNFLLSQRNFHNQDFRKKWNTGSQTGIPGAHNPAALPLISIGIGVASYGSSTPGLKSMEKFSMKKAILSLTSFVLLACSLSLRADSVLTTVIVGNEPGGVAVNPVTNKVYVGVLSTGQVLVLDGRTQKITARIAAQGFLLAANPVTNRIYAASCNPAVPSCNVAVINGRNNKVIANVPINSGSEIGIQGLTVNPVNNRIYVSDADNAQYIVIDGNTNSIIAQVPVFNQPAGLAVDPKTNHLFVAAAGFPGEVLVFDGATNTQIAAIPESFGVENVADNFRLNRAYATVTTTNDVSVIDTTANVEVTEVPTEQFPNGIDVNLLNNRVYVVNSNSASVTIINGNTNQVLQTLPIPATFARNIAVNPVTGFSYITDSSSDQVIVLTEK
jgi:YVTN family beta-propeller protein